MNHNVMIRPSSALALGLGLAVALALSTSALAQDAAGAQQTAGAALAAPLEERHEGMGRTLEDFFTAAVEYSPALKIAEERWKIGESRRRSANGQLLPQIVANVSISDNRQENFEGVTTYRGDRYSLQLRQVLFDWRVFSQRSQAYLMENLYEAEYYAELAELLNDIANRYFDVLETSDALASSESELEAVSSQLSQVERMYGLQMVQVTDLYEAQARFAQIEAERVYLESEATLAREALRAATGLAVGDLYNLGDEPNLPIVNGNVEEWVRRARLNNQMIQARELAVDLADQRISEARGNYMPRVDLVMQQQRSDLGYDNTRLPSRTDTGYIGLNVSVPLFTGGSNRASVREARSQHNIAENELRQLNLDISERTRLAYLRLQSTERQIGASSALVDSRRISATAMQRGFDLGTVTTVDVLDAVRQQFQAERDLQSMHYEYIRLSLALRLNAGTLDAEDLLSISETLVSPGE